jgi:hypothetical protein
MVCFHASPHCCARSVKLEQSPSHADTSVSTLSAAATAATAVSAAAVDVEDDADMQSQQHSDTADVSGTVDGSVLHRRRRHQQAQINNATLELFYHSLKGDLQAIAHHVSSLHHYSSTIPCRMQCFSCYTIHAAVQLT